MVHFSKKASLLLAIATTWLKPATAADADHPVRIKSKTTSGNGCPHEHWVTTNVVPSLIPGVNENATLIDIGYMDFTPEISPQQVIQLAASSCQVVLKLDQMRPGYQFSVVLLRHSISGHIDQWNGWYQKFATDFSLAADGPFARASRTESLGNNVNFNADKNLGEDKVSPEIWSQCFKENETADLFINERVTLGWTSNFVRPKDVSAWLGRTDTGSIPYSTRFGISWRACE